MNSRFHPLRAAIIASCLRLGGAEKQTSYIARALLLAGIDVRLFYLGDGGFYEPMLRGMGIPVHKISFPNRPWTILARLTGALRKWRPEIVLVPQFGDLPFGAPAGRLSGALTFGGVRSDGLRELRVHGMCHGMMLRLVHGVIANSETAKRNLLSRGTGARKIAVLPNVIDLQEFDAARKRDLEAVIPTGRLLAAAIGSLHRCKRFDRFLDALALARRVEPGLAGVIVGGDHGTRAELEARAKELGLNEPDLTFLGECKEVPALLGRAGFLVLSSEREGFPNVILEAMAAGLPVITTPAGDAGLIVRHCKTGLVVDGGDSGAMAESMIRLARSPSMRSNLGQAGRARVEEQYDFASLAGRLISNFQWFAALHGNTALLERIKRFDQPGRAPLFAEASLGENEAVATMN